MRKFKVKIEPEALVDIQEITDWYNDQQENGTERNPRIWLTKTSKRS